MSFSALVLAGALCGRLVLTPEVPPETPEAKERRERVERIMASGEALMDEFDKDGDGKLSQAELEVSLKVRAERRHQARLKQYDEDGDGKLNRLELRRERADQATAALRQDERLAVFDHNGSGQIDLDELDHYLAFLTRYSSARARLMGVCDVDGDGKLSAQERAKYKDLNEKVWATLIKLEVRKREKLRLAREAEQKKKEAKDD